MVPCGSAGTRATACFHKKEALSESFDPLAARGLQPHSFSAIFGQLTSDQKFRPARSSGSAAPFFKIDGRREVVRFEWPGAGPKGTSQAADTLGCSRSGVVSIEALKRMSPGRHPGFRRVIDVGAAAGRVGAFHYSSSSQSPMITPKAVLWRSIPDGEWLPMGLEDMQ